MFNQQHQNININISCCLGLDKVPKRPLAKRNLKPSKLETRTESCELQTKLTRKNHQNPLGKNNDHKRSNQQKKNKSKKISTASKNANTSYIFNERRIKTEEPMVDNDYTSAFKKSSKTYNYHKNFQQPIKKASDLFKKAPSFAKSSQTFKSTQLNSCKMFNSKKLSIQQAEYSTLQVPSIPLKRRRAQSTIISQDKIVSKLLNDSILDSELAGSLPNTYESRESALSQSCRLKQYMSSVDMRIINSMQNDVPIFADQKHNPQQNTVRRILKSKKISLEELTRKVVFLQRFFRQKIQEKVIYKYKVLFQSVSYKMKIKPHLHEISGCSFSFTEYQEDSYQHSRSLLEDQNMISAAGSSIRRKTSITSEQNQPFEIRTNKAKFSKQIPEEDGSLNFRKYRQLVNQEINKLDSSKKSNYKKKHSSQRDQQFSDILDQIQLYNCEPITSEPIKQPKCNSIWTDNIFDSSQQQPKLIQELSSQILKSQQLKVKFSEKQEKVHPFQLSINQTNIDKLKNDDSVDVQSQEHIYDKMKYQQNSEDRAKNSAVSADLKFHDLENDISSVERISMSVKANSFLGLQKQQIAKQNFVTNYLDCGLIDFGIDIDKKIAQLPKALKANLEQNQNQLNNLQDQAVGSKFEQANYVKLIEPKDSDQLKIQSHLVAGSRNSLQLDQIIEDIYSFLVTEFATEISLIMRKAPGIQETKPRPPKCPGIVTNFDSIRDYLRKFICFLKKQEQYLNKITVTINKDIGPTSLQILSYLRPQPLELSSQLQVQQEDQGLDDQEGLFVVPAEYFQQFQDQQQNQYRRTYKKQMNHRIKAFSNFWHRCIFQCFNECLDFQRPYGIQGKPYLWVTQPNLYRGIIRQRILFHLQRAQHRVLQLATIVGGIIFQNPDNAFQEEYFSEQQKHMMNEERLSRILGNEIFQSQPTWINYNDQTAQLLVQLSRIMEQRLFIECASEIKKLLRKRKMILNESQIEQEAIFINLERSDL